MAIWLIPMRRSGRSRCADLGVHDGPISARNGGSCIRITNSLNTQIINNTCVNNGQDPTAKYHDEIFFSDTNKTHTGALLRNNLCIPTSGQVGLTMGSGVTAQNNLFSGTSSLVVSTVGALDLSLVANSSAIDAGASGSPTPTEEIGFDWKCIKQESGQAVSWWNYAVDYAYITQIGGVAKCFNPKTRAGSPDVGAYEYNGTLGNGGAPATGGTSATAGAGGVLISSGGAASAGGISGIASSTSSGGGAVGGANPGSSIAGGLASGGTSGLMSGVATTVAGGTTAAGGAPSSSETTGGAASQSGTNGDLDSSEDGGCMCRTVSSHDGRGFIGFCAMMGLGVMGLRRRCASAKNHRLNE